MTTTSHILTAEDLWHMPQDRRYELVKGELRTMAPSGFDHGAIIVNLTMILANHVKANKLGVVLGAETGFVLSRRPDTLRGTDAAFVKAARIPSTGRPTTYWEGAPDLAVEVLSPSDTVEDTEEKVDDYLNAGAQLVWIVNPKRRSVWIHRPNANPTILREADTLDGEDVIPGFHCKVADLFL